MDLRQLEYFMTVAKLSSLTKAADVLYTTQPHVSMVIHSLEKELGVNLFRRRSKGVEITEEGIQLFGYAEKIIKDVDMARQIGSETGKTWLKVASNPSSNMASVFSSYYNSLREEGIYLKFTECGIEEMIDKMSRERYDLGFVFVPMDRQFALKMMAERRHLEYVELFRSDLVLHVGELHPCYARTSITPDELYDYEYIQLDEDYFTVEDLLGSEWKNRSREKVLNRVISTNSDHLMIRMLEEGKVCNIGSYWLKDKFKEHSFHMIPIEGYEEAVSFGYLKHRHHALRAEAARFMEFLMSNVF